MAIMLPEKPKECDRSSLEDIMFDSLAKLPDDYYVFHSFKIVKIEDGVVRESETDFVVFNKNKGILCIEAKAGQVSYNRGTWFYGSGIQMKGDGPFSQAAKNKWNVKKMLDDKIPNLSQNCKIIHCVWFPSIDKNKLNGIEFPSEADKDLVMTRESIENPLEPIEKIFSLEVAKGIETKLNERDCYNIIRKVLCPTFELVPAKNIELELSKNKFNRLLQEQSVILDFIEEQRSAIINGIAGTGKTMIAVEKARRSTLTGKVLFLCFNSKLKDYLKETFNYDNVDYYTIDGFACKVCGRAVADFKKLQEKLFENLEDKQFPYAHVIIDEGQDFGQERIEECDIIELLEENVLRKENGTFFLFYDKLQLIQGEKIPSYITNADCKLTLYRNCRNTKNIANTSLKPLAVVPKLFDGAIDGATPKLHFAKEDVIDKIKLIMDNYLNKGIENIVLLTCGQEWNSTLNVLGKNGYFEYRNRDFDFTSCKKFKGLEADVIILLDVDKDTLINHEKTFYVGTSRARISLEIIATTSEAECVAVLNKLNYPISAKSKMKQLATALGCVLVN